MNRPQQRFTILCAAFVLLFGNLSSFCSAVKVTRIRPGQNAEIEAGTGKFRARVVVSPQESESGVEVTKVQLQYGDEAWEDAFRTRVRQKPNGAVWTVVRHKRSVSAGKIQWRIKVDVNDGTEIISEWKGLTVLSPDEPEGDGPPINNAITAIRGVIRGNNDLRAMFVRLGFHDCVGGCDGCVNLSNPENFGLDVPINALSDVVKQYAINGLTRADIWAMAAMIGAQDSQRNNASAQTYDIHWYGRPTNCDATGGIGAETDPDPAIPSATLIDSASLKDFFSKEFQFNARQTTAIMGAHSIGKLSLENSGFDGPNGWVRNNHRLDNQYYAGLIGRGTTLAGQLRAPNWNQVLINNADPIPDRFQWNRGRRGGGGGGNRRREVMTNADIALVRNFSGSMTGGTGQVTCPFRGNRDGPSRCPHATEFFDFAAEFRNDNAAFLLAFHDAFMRILHQNAGGNDFRTTCASPPCAV